MSLPDLALGGSPKVDVSTVRHTHALRTRASRVADYEGDRDALSSILRALEHTPDSILDTLVGVALEHCGAQSAGLSFLRPESEEPGFFWPAIAGAWTRHVGGTTPRDHSPCGIVLDCNAPQLFLWPARYYGYLANVDPPVVEALLAPFHVDGTIAGTLWVVLHDNHRCFDAEDERRLQGLARCASGAYQIVTSLDRLNSAGKASDRARRDLLRVESLLHGEGLPSRCYLPLSHREREVVCLVAQGHVNKVIAESLGVGVKTIETYRARASDKLGFRHRSDFVRYALDQGWLTGASTPVSRSSFT